MKWDGFRLLAFVRDGKVELLSRNLHPFTALLRPIADSLRSFPAHLILDGEAVMLDERGRPDFEALQALLRPRDRKRPTGHLAYIVFDCLHINGQSLMRRPLDERRRVLEAVVKAVNSARVRPSEAFSGIEGTRLFRRIAKLGLEGVVAKRKDSPYRPGIRSHDWLKIPYRRREGFVIGGYLARDNRLAALVIGHHNRRDHVPYAGVVGPGWTVARPEFRRFSSAKSMYVAGQ